MTLDFLLVEGSSAIQMRFLPELFEGQYKEEVLAFNLPNRILLETDEANGLLSALKSLAKRSAITDKSDHYKKTRDQATS